MKLSIFEIIFIVGFFVLAVFNWEYIVYFNSPAKRIATQHDARPVLYSTDWCQYCKRIRDTLTQNSVAFFEYDIEKSRKAKRQFDELGGKGVPLMLVNSEVIPGFNSSVIQDLIESDNKHMVGTVE